MKVWKVWVGKDEHNSMFSLCEDENNAKTNLEHLRRVMPNMESGIAQMEGQRCKCGHLFSEEEGECLRCEQLQFDAMVEMAEEQQRREDTEEWGPEYEED